MAETVAPRLHIDVDIDGSRFFTFRGDVEMSVDTNGVLTIRDYALRFDNNGVVFVAVAGAWRRAHMVPDDQPA